jgi:hypothetical protein
MAGPGGGGGGGGRGGGRGMGNQPLSVKLDGTETTVETQRGKSTFTAKWMGEGQTLEIKAVRNINIQGNEMTLTTTEHWELAEDGKILKVHQTTETPNGSQESKLVFNKK